MSLNTLTFFFLPGADDLILFDPEGGALCLFAHYEEVFGSFNNHRFLKL
jgi:hypothetical protein